MTPNDLNMQVFRAIDGPSRGCACEVLDIDPEEVSS